MISQIPHFNSLQDALDFIAGSPTRIVGKTRISGGDINDAFALTLENAATTVPAATTKFSTKPATYSSARKIFMKSNTFKNIAFFEAEATGLLAIESLKKIGTPKILALGTDGTAEAGFSFLLLDFIERSVPVKNYWRIFGQELAQFHKADCSEFWGYPATELSDNVAISSKAGRQIQSTRSEISAISTKKFGFPSNNFIGRTKQINTPSDSWIEFFRDYRLRPQIKMTQKYFESDLIKKIDKILDHLDKFLIEPKFPSLVHGDLWRGNVLCGNDGKAMLIDPAAYVGFYEVDLAMTELFGSFPRDFYEGYYEVTPKIAGYENRREIYNLYHLLNHLNLFGEGYLGVVKNTVENIATVFYL